MSQNTCFPTGVVQTQKPVLMWPRNMQETLSLSYRGARRLLRPLSKSGKMIGEELGDWAIWSVVEQSSRHIGIEQFGAHDLRRPYAKLCRKNGGDLEQIKFLLGHSSIQTTECYLGSEQEMAVAVDDNLGL